eukprot:COSAG01_NODE_26029_length_725_cov_3.150160_2_plen_61_part_00
MFPVYELQLAAEMISPMASVNGVREMRGVYFGTVHRISHGTVHRSECDLTEVLHDSIQRQ